MSSFLLKTRTASKLRLAGSLYPALFKYYAFKIPTPFMVTFGVTNKCNLNCSYCFAGLKNRVKKDTPVETLIDYINQFYHIGTRLFDLQGGEPTLRDDLGVLIDHIDHIGASCSVATNGHQVEKHIDSFQKCLHICVSLDGTRELTNRNRGETAYDTAINALKLLHNNEVELRLHSVLTNQTQTQDIDHLLDLAIHYKTNVNFVYSLESGNNVVDSTDSTGFSEHNREIVRYLFDKKKAGAPITSKEGALQQVLNWPYTPQKILLDDEMGAEDYKLMKNLNIPRCLWGKMACFFNSDGFLAMCPRGFDREDYSVYIGNKVHI